MPRATPLSPEARAFMDVAFSRNLGILTPAEQDALARAKVAVPGLGGVGGLHVAALARLGVGAFSLADPDVFELANLNRQYGATTGAMGKSKLEVMAGQALEINPHLALDLFPRGVEADTLDEFLSGADLVVDGLDFFAFDIRRALFNRARERGVPVVTAAPLGFTCSVLTFTPEGMSFDEYFDIQEGLPMREKLLRFAVGLAPGGLHLSQMDPSRVSLDLGRGPSLAVACHLCAALAATRAVMILAGRPGVRPAPWSLQVDPLTGRARSFSPRRGNASLAQRAKLWYVRAFMVGPEPVHARREPPRPAPDPGAGSPPREQLLWLARAASQAPSGDNCQPWRFALSGGGLDILLNRDEDQSFFNFRQLASVAACGAAALNVAVSAPGLGWEARTDLAPAQDEPDLMARISFEPAPATPHPLAAAVWTRTTNRRPFSRRPVEVYSLEEMARAAAPGGLDMVVDPPALKRLARLVYLADRIRVERRDLHEHFIAMTRFDPPDGRQATDGLPLKNLYAGAAGEGFLRLTRPWGAMRAANALGLGRLVALHSLMALRRGPAAGIVFTDEPTVRGFLEGGMAMQRVWLTATRLGVAFQPMTAITLFLLRWRLEGPGSFSDAHSRLLEGVWPGLEELFPGIGSDGRWPVMLFRAGYARPVGYGTPRREPEESLASR